MNSHPSKSSQLTCCTWKFQNCLTSARRFSCFIALSYHELQSLSALMTRKSLLESKVKKFLTVLVETLIPWTLRLGMSVFDVSYSSIMYRSLKSDRTQLWVPFVRPWRDGMNLQFKLRGISLTRTGRGKERVNKKIEIILIWQEQMSNLLASF